MKSICVYNENCVLAGLEVYFDTLERKASTEDWHDEDVVEGNAVWHEAIGGHYHATIAETIRKALEEEEK